MAFVISHNQIQYSIDYAEHFSDRSLVDKKYVDSAMAFQSIKTKQIDGLEDRLKRIEDYLFGEYQNAKFKNKLNGASEFSNNPAEFFQSPTNEWKKVFQELNINISNADVEKIANIYNAPKKCN
jgi:hypothetical protein